MQINNLLYLFFVCVFSFSFNLSVVAEDLHLKCSGTALTMPGYTKYSSDYLVDTMEQTIQGMEVDATHQEVEYTNIQRQAKLIL